MLLFGWLLVTGGTVGGNVYKDKNKNTVLAAVLAGPVHNRVQVGPF